jgi:hypothetical protein
VEAVPDIRASFLVVADSYGCNRLFADYGFTAHFARTTTGRTTLRIETFYSPVNPIAAALNTLIIRRGFRHVVDEMLDGLHMLSEQR